MWELKTPAKVKLIIGILAADDDCLNAAIELIKEKFGQIDITSDPWPFTQTSYYEKEIGKNIIRQFVSIEKPVSPARLAKIKLKTNKLEQQLAEKLTDLNLPRPVNLDPGIIEPSKLVLATTKNYSHRIYIGKNIYAEVTLIYDKGQWQPQNYTYPDYKLQCYHEFFNKVRKTLLEKRKF